MSILQMFLIDSRGYTEIISYFSDVSPEKKTTEMKIVNKKKETGLKGTSNAPFSKI